MKEVILQILFIVFSLALAFVVAVGVLGGWLYLLSQ